jgi:hypothetical protein
MRHTVDARGMYKGCLRYSEIGFLRSVSSPVSDTENTCLPARWRTDERRESTGCSYVHVENASFSPCKVRVSVLTLSYRKAVGLCRLCAAVSPLFVGVRRARRGSAAADAPRRLPLRRPRPQPQVRDPVQIAVHDFYSYQIHAPPAAVWSARVGASRLLIVVGRGRRCAPVGLGAWSLCDR